MPNFSCCRRLPVLNCGCYGKIYISQVRPPPIQKNARSPQTAARGARNLHTRVDKCEKNETREQLRTQLEEVEELLARADKAHSLLTTGPEC